MQDPNLSQNSGGAETCSTNPDEGTTSHFDATHMGTEEGGGIQRAMAEDSASDAEERDAEERDHMGS